MISLMPGFLRISSIYVVFLRMVLYLFADARVGGGGGGGGQGRSQKFGGPSQLWVWDPP